MRLSIGELHENQPSEGSTFFVDINEIAFTWVLFSYFESKECLVVKVLCYKSEGRGFDSRRCHWNLSLT